MIAITSISPVHIHGDHQQNCIQSWINAGYEVHSLNHRDEIERIKEFYPQVKFFPTHRTHLKTLGKPYVIISALIDHAKEQKDDHYLLINSDIEIYDKDSVTTNNLKRWSEDGIIVIHRQDYDQDINYFRQYVDGIDGFFLNKKWLDVYPQTLLCMGQCFWDYWMPWIPIRQNVKVFTPSAPYLFHKMHNAQYSPDNWKKFGKIMMTETGMDKNFINKTVGQFSDAIKREWSSNYIAV